MLFLVFRAGLECYTVCATPVQIVLRCVLAFVNQYCLSGSRVTVA